MSVRDHAVPTKPYSILLAMLLASIASCSSDLDDAQEDWQPLEMAVDAEGHLQVRLDPFDVRLLEEGAQPSSATIQVGVPVVVRDVKRERTLRFAVADRGRPLALEIDDEEVQWITEAGTRLATDEHLGARIIVRALWPSERGAMAADTAQPTAGTALTSTTSSAPPVTLAYITNLGDRTEIMGIAGDGEGARNLSRDPMAVFSPDFSRHYRPHLRGDGRTVYFHAYETPGRENAEIFSVDVEQGTVTRLTDEAGDQKFPALDRSGSRLAFTSYEDGRHRVVVMDRASGAATVVSEDLGDARFPAWRPDGLKIAFDARPKGGGAPDIYLVRPDGTDLRRLTHSEANDHYPAWSPDGNHIAFTSIPPVPDSNPSSEPTPELWIVRADGTARRRLLPEGETGQDPAWSPDGRCLAYASDDDGRRDIYLLRIDARDGEPVSIAQTPTRLTRAMWRAWNPAWNPEATDDACGALTKWANRRQIGSG